MILIYEWGPDKNEDIFEKVTAFTLLHFLLWQTFVVKNENYQNKQKR